jgi:hypothetical protein
MARRDGDAMNGARIALAMMCKAPIEGESKTRLCPPLTMREAAALSRCFIADVAAVIDGLRDESGIDGAVVYTPAEAAYAFDGLIPATLPRLPQRGIDLGERLLHATEDLRSAGYAGVCLMNADSPTLPAWLLRQAVAALNRPGDRIVLGPASDGGYCLIGLKQPYAALFDDMPWSSSHVLTETMARVADLGLPLTLLPMWYDVDDRGSLRLLLHELFGAGNRFFVNGMTGASAPHTRRELARLLRLPNAARFGFPHLPATG